MDKSSGKKTGAQSSPVRAEAINEIGTLARNRDYRARRVENTQLKEVRGKEHWMLHTLLYVYERMENRLNHRIEKNRSEMDTKFYENSQELVLLKNEITELINLLRKELLEAEGKLSEQMDKNLNIIDEKNAENAQIISGDTNAFIREASNETTSEINALKREIADMKNKIQQIEKISQDMAADFGALEESLRIEIQETAKEINKPLQEAIRDTNNTLAKMNEKLEEIAAKKK